MSLNSGDGNISNDHRLRLKDSELRMYHKAASKLKQKGQNLVLTNKLEIHTQTNEYKKMVHRSKAYN